MSDARRRFEVPQLVDNATIAVAAGATLPLVTAAALVGVRGEISVADTALALVIAIVVSAWIAGRSAGIVASIVAAASLNFFHTKPYLSLAIGSRGDVLTVALLLVVGLAVGSMGARRRSAIVTADINRNELGRLHRVAELAARGAATEDVIHAVEAELLVTLSLDDCHFEGGPAGTRRRAHLERNGAVTGSDGQHTVGRNGAFALPSAGIEIAVLGRGIDLGRIICEPTPGEGVDRDRRVAAIILSDQLGAALAARTRT